MSKRRPPRNIDWSTTHKVREALAKRRYVVSVHVRAKLPHLDLSLERFLDLLATGFVLTRRQKDETRTATDGYKHFLEGLTGGGAIIEVVLKFVPSRRWPGEELMILVTAYRGKA